MGKVRVNAILYVADEEADLDDKTGMTEEAQDKYTDQLLELGFGTIEFVREDD